MKKRLSNEQIEENFSEISPPMSKAEALLEANRCLYCYDAPCIKACPTHIDVPSFIKKIATDNLTGSARVIFDANPIGATCAKVCPVDVLCEGACVEKTLVEKPIEIGRLQRYATDFALENDKKLFEKGEPNGKSVGVIGSGPAGLSCSAYLARLGFDVTIYEKKALPGGLDTYGMAEYKMTQEDSLDEVDFVKSLGVKILLTTKIGEDISFDELLEKHDAVFLGIGLGKTRDLEIEGENLKGVYEALNFIELVKTRQWKEVPLGEVVAVIGAGNTAIDAVTQAKRLGAKRVLMVYRRTAKDISAYDYEFEIAKSDGIEFVWQTSPLEIVGNGSVEKLICKKTDGSDEIYEIPCEMVIKAIGQKKQIGFLEKIGIDFDEKGQVKVNEKMQTSHPKVFAGGDCVNGGAEAVDASQMGKLAAMGIQKEIFGEDVVFAGAKV